MKQPNNRKITIWIIVAICAAGFLLYGGSLQNGYNLDDDYVCENHELVKQGIKGIPEIFASRYNNSGGVMFGYRPVTIAIYAIEYQIFGESTTIGHFFNVIYYIIACIILFFFLSKLLETKFSSTNLLISIVVTAIFMAHAIHSEVVLSLKNREEILCLIFCLSSALLALRYYDKRKIIDIIFAIILLGIGFLTKESAIVFLAIIPLVIIFFRTDIKIPSFSNAGKKIATYFKRNIFLATFGCLVLALLMARVIINWKFDFMPAFLKGAVIRPIYFVFLISYIIIKIIRRNKESISRRNIILWSIVLVLTILWNYWALIVATIMLLVTLSEDDEIAATPNWKINKSWQKIKVILPFALILIFATAAIAIAYYIPESVLPKSNAVMSKWQNPIFTEESSSSRFAIAMYSLAFYLKLLFVPYPLRYYYGYSLIPDVGLENPIAIISIIVHIALIIVAIWLFNRRNLISFGILFYLIGIFPFSNLFFPFTGIIGERMLFAPSIGFAIAIGYIIILISKSEKSISKGKKLAVCIMTAIIVIPNAVIAINRNHDWKDRETLFAHDIEYSAESAKANVLYANLLSRNAYDKLPSVAGTPAQEKCLKDIKKSENLYRQALAIDSTYGNAWYNLAYLKQIVYQDYDNSEIMFEKALKYDSTLNNSYYFLGMAKSMKGKHREAIANLERYDTATIYDSKFYDLTYFFIGKSYFELGENTKATEYYKLCIDSLRDENFQHVVPELSKFVETTKDYALGIHLGKQEVKHFPDKDLPYVDLGNYYMMAGDTINAIENWEIAYDKFKGNKNIAATLYNYFKEKGNKEKADYYLNQYNTK
ncbi:MAG: glycosyltransferase family 39 protein [Bacteroidales bacterium]|nr:glycosyltransferase family 39 protein [Bacteroidales bacterium]